MIARQPTDTGDLLGEPRSFDLRDYWRIVKRRMALVLLLTVIGGVAGAGYAVYTGHTFAATAQVLVSPVTQGPATSTNQPSNSQVNMSTEQAVAQSPPVIIKAARLLRVSPTALQASASKQLTVAVPASTLTTSTVLQITWDAKNPAAAQAGANAFASAYLSYRHQVLASQVAVLTQSLTRQINSVQRQIAQANTQLAHTVLAGIHQILTIRLHNLSDQLAADNTQLASLSTYNVSGGSLITAARPLSATGLSHYVILALGLLLGLLAGLVLAFARDALDDRIRDTDQLERKLGAGMLAVLPPDASAPDQLRVPGGQNRRTLPLISTATNPESRAAESVRTLRATLTAVAARSNMRSLLVVAADTSASSGQLAAELGVALAESGRSVLLVASDMRGSVLPALFDVPNNAGLSDLLVSGGDPEVVLRHPLHAGGATLPAPVARQLTVLPQGPRLAYALAVLDSPAMVRLLHTQREAFDFILLDAPPASVAADAFALAANVDGVIVAVREGVTRERAVEEVGRRMAWVGAVLAGAVYIGKTAAGQYRSGGGAPVRVTQPGRVAAAPSAGDDGPAPWSGPGRPPRPARTRPMPAVSDEPDSEAVSSGTKRSAQ